MYYCKNSHNSLKTKYEKRENRKFIFPYAVRRQLDIHFLVTNICEPHPSSVKI